jgi:hypothetical protein
MLTCEACKSENIQKLSLVYEGGLSLIQGKQSGVGIGLGGESGLVGVGTSKFKGTNQSVLSRNAAPPAKKKPYKVGLIYLFCVWLISQFAPGNLAIVLILIIGGGLHVYGNIRYNQRVFPILFQKWNSSFLCLVCGTISGPLHDRANPQLDSGSPR